MGLPDGSAAASPPQQDNAPWHNTKTAQEGLREHYKEPKLSTRPPNSPDPNPIKLLLEQVWFMEAPPSKIEDPNDPLQTSRCKTKLWPVDRLDIELDDGMNVCTNKISNSY